MWVDGAGPSLVDPGASCHLVSLHCHLVSLHPVASCHLVSLHPVATVSASPHRHSLHTAGLEAHGERRV